MTCILLIRGEDTKQKRKPFEDKDRAWSDSAIRQGMTGASRSWKDSPTEPSEGLLSFGHLDAHHTQPPELGVNTFKLFKASKFVVICYSSLENSYGMKELMKYSLTKWTEYFENYGQCLLGINQERLLRKLFFIDHE